MSNPSIITRIVILKNLFLFREWMEERPKRYVSVDVESAGRVPGIFSMISFGACLVDNLETTFYAEIKPINRRYHRKAMEVACKQIHLLSRKKEDLRYDSNRSEFSPSLVLDFLIQHAEPPESAMERFYGWVEENSVGCRPVMAAAPAAFDTPFIHYYFELFCRGRNPFGFGGEDINSMYRGAKRDCSVNIKDLNLRPAGELSHNALEDAIQQAVEMQEVLKVMSQKK